MADQDPGLVGYRIAAADGGATVAVLTFDDGKANALSHAAIDAVDSALSRALDDDAGAVVLCGRPGRFCAGFDLSVMTEGQDGARRLLGHGAELWLRLLEYPRPVVVAATGHALAAGAITLIAADHRVGATGEFKIGLNEVAIGIPVPAFVVEMARARLSRRHFTAATSLAHLYGPPDAVDAGYLDELAEPDAVVATAVDRALTLASTLKRRAFEVTRSHDRAALVTTVRSLLDDDLAAFFVDPEN